MKYEKLKKRQYKYQVGSVVKFHKRFFIGYNWKNWGTSLKTGKYQRGVIEKEDIGIVKKLKPTMWNKRGIFVDVYRKGELILRDKEVTKSYDVYLISKEEAIMEQL